MTPPFRTILGISFFTGSLDDALEIARGGGLILVPSGPGLANLTRDPAYRAALENSDLNLTDSGLMVLTWFVRSGERVERLSGLRFLRGLLDDSDFRARGSSYWIMPSAREERINLRWLEGRGISVASQSSYVAPLFSGPEVEDEKLIDVLQKKRPQYILINIGGGVQEKLGYYLKRRLSYVPTIVCTGAAIALFNRAAGNHSGMGGPSFSRLVVSLSALARGIHATLLAGRPIGGTDLEIWRPSAAPGSRVRISPQV